MAVLPPDSPVISPIEMCGPSCNAKSRKKGCTVLEEAREGVLDEVPAMPKLLFTNLANSLPKGVARVLQLTDDKPQYGHVLHCEGALADFHTMLGK